MGESDRAGHRTHCCWRMGSSWWPVNMEGATTHSRLCAAVSEWVSEYLVPYIGKNNPHIIRTALEVHFDSRWYTLQQVHLFDIFTCSSTVSSSSVSCSCAICSSICSSISSNDVLLLSDDVQSFIIVSVLQSISTMADTDCWAAINITSGLSSVQCLPDFRLLDTGLSSSYHYQY